MKFCTLVLASVNFLANSAYAHLGYKRLRASKASTSPVRDSLWGTLLERQWTLFLGDSILGGQFLTLAQELGATPDEAVLSGFTPCAQAGGQWPTMPAVLNLMSEPIEFLLLCGPQGCKFSRLGCMNFYATQCSTPGICLQECTGTTVWDGMIQNIKQAISHPDHFAVSFHWAPSYFPHDNVYDRLGQFVPGALIWNNCNHWMEHDPHHVAQPEKLALWLSYVDSSAALLEEFVELPRLAYQGCTVVPPCDDYAPGLKEQCQARKDWVAEANTAAQTLIRGRGQTFIDLTPLLPDEVLKTAFMDGSHPCMPVPCMWTDPQMGPPRQCCQSLLLHSFHTMLSGSSGSIPTFLNASGVRSKVNQPVNVLFENVLGIWGAANPNAIPVLNPVNLSQSRS